VPVFLLSLTFFLSGFISQVENSYKVHDLRRFFYEAADNKNKCEALVAHLSKYRGSDPAVYGYKAATQALMADHAWSPYYKIKYVRNAAQLFAEIIKKSPQVTEVRFLRYSMEYYIPRYLNMSGHLQEDRSVILKSLFRYPQSDLDPEIFRRIKDFLLKNDDHLTEQERKQVANLKA